MGKGEEANKELPFIGREFKVYTIYNKFVPADALMVCWLDCLLAYWQERLRYDYLAISRCRVDKVLRQRS